MQSLQVAAVVMALSFTISAEAQSNNPLTAGTKHLFDLVKRYVSVAADKMPEEYYSFRAVPEERDFGQFIGHIADANFFLCSVAAGEKPPAGGFENGRTSKADLTKALSDSYTYCDSVFAKMTDEEGKTIVKFIGGGAIQRRPEEMPKLSVLQYDVSHNFEHYGNLVVYMRLKAVVPPSSETPLSAGANTSEHKAIDVARTMLAQYVGTYELNPGNTIVVTLAGDQLFGQMTGRGAIALFPETPNRFFAKVLDAQLEFVKSDNGVVTHAVLHLLGRDQKAVKKNP